MEGHNVLTQQAFHITYSSTGSMPNVYAFGTLYDDMYQDLKDKYEYMANGTLPMLDFNQQLKHAPVQWQAGAFCQAEIISTCEEQCFYAIFDDLFNQGGELQKPVQLINVVIKDDHEEAILAGKALLEHCGHIKEWTDIDGELEGIFE
ncbi:hypothetical protein CROQUDRAFT_677123 [Cronartium quercuum f. sp. fusiforme G11]|uniref:RNA polymerase II subunit A C-terminal domain phosphatase SSU72 n=1 Tax=Cronartium quercuum f. sp. fusiforme G11 TaxID=708437 RepID=A0A9P6NHN1_9BASI|nr:hypothetical protein CROQUDRAFT_677123 [Cronartium quercuum f. sp. fusiforme G11]